MKGYLVLFEDFSHFSFQLHHPCLGFLNLFANSFALAPQWCDALPFLFVTGTVVFAWRAVLVEVYLRMIDLFLIFGFANCLLLLIHGETVR